MKDRILIKLGIKESSSKAKLTFKHSILNIEEDVCKVDHHRSIHSKSLQRSKYLMIDDEIESLKKTFQIQNTNIKDKIN